MIKISEEQSLIGSISIGKGDKGDTPSIAHLESSIDTLINNVNQTESERAINESNRVAAENIRSTKEAARINEENTRNNNEAARQNGEATRIDAESARLNAEKARNSNEVNRVNAENIRKSNETARIDAENTRLNEFNKIKTNAAALETNITKKVDDKIIEIDTTNATFKEEMNSSFKVYSDKMDNFDRSLSTDLQGVKYPNANDRFNAEFDHIHQRFNNAEYLAYEGYGVTAKNTYFGLTKDNKIEGHTVQNLVQIPNKTEVTSSVMNVEAKTSQKLDNTVEGKVDLAIKGRTLQNLVDTIDGNGLINGQHKTISSASLLKPSTLYTILIHNKGNEVVEFYTNPDRFPFKTLTIESGKIFIVKHTTISQFVNPFGLWLSNNVPQTSVQNIDILLLEGDHTNTPIEELPFGKGIYSVGEAEKVGDKYKVGVKSTGKNLFNKDANKWLYWDNSPYTESTDGSAIVWCEPANTGKRILRTMNFIAKKSVYYLKCKSEIISGDVTPNAYFKSQNNENYGIGNSLEKGRRFENLTIGDEYNISFYVDANNTGKIKFYDIELSDEPIITEYHSYQEDEKYLLLDEPLRSLSNGVCDEIIGDELIRRVGKVVLNGNEEWEVNSPGILENTIPFYTRAISDKKTTSGNNFIIEKFIIKNTLFEDIEASWCETGNTVLYIKINKNKLTENSLGSFKQWLQQNPTTVYYELVTPIITKLDKLPRVSTYGGTTHINSTNSLVPNIAIESKGNKYPCLLKPNTQYQVMWNGSNGGANVTIDLGGTIKTVQKSLGSTLITTPSTLIHSDLYIGGDNVTLTNVMATEKTYSVPFVEGIESVNNDLVMKSCGKNLFDKTIKENILQNNFVKTNGEISLATGTLSIRQKVKPNCIYSLSGNYNRSVVRFEDINNTYISHTNNKIITTPSNCEYIVWYIGNEEILNKTVDKVQIEENSVETTHEPYKEDVRQITLSEPLRSLPNGVCDEIANGKLIRRVGKVVLDGGKSWTPHQVDDVYISFIGSIKDEKQRYDNKICDKFKVTQWVGKLDEMLWLQGGSSWGICIKKDKLQTQDIQGFKEWVQANPITIYYELAEPIITDLEPLAPLKSFDGTTHIIASSIVQPKIYAKIPSNVNEVLIDTMEENNLLKNKAAALNAELESATETLSDLIIDNKDLTETLISTKVELNTSVQALNAMDNDLIATNWDMDYRIFEIE